MEWRGGCRQTPVWSTANTRIWPNAVSILAHRQRRWANIETTLGQVLVFPERAVCIWIHGCRLCLVGTGCTVLCVATCMAMHTTHTTPGSNAPHGSHTPALRGVAKGGVRYRTLNCLREYLVNTNIATVCWRPCICIWVSRNIFIHLKLAVNMNIQLAQN